MYLHEGAWPDTAKGAYAHSAYTDMGGVRGLTIQNPLISRSHTGMEEQKIAAHLRNIVSYAS